MGVYSFYDSICILLDSETMITLMNNQERYEAERIILEVANLTWIYKAATKELKKKTNKKKNSI